MAAGGTPVRRIVCCHRLSFRASQLGHRPACCRGVSPAGGTFGASLLLPRVVERVGARPGPEAMDCRRAARIARAGGFRTPNGARPPLGGAWSVWVRQRQWGSEPTSSAAPPTAAPNETSSAASSATSLAKSSKSSPQHPRPLPVDEHRGIKHKRHGVNVQVIADAAGRLIWASTALPGATHDLSAARAHGIIDSLTGADVMTFADKGYQGDGGSVRTQFKRHRYRPKLFRRQKTIQRAGHWPLSGESRRLPCEGSWRDTMAESRCRSSSPRESARAAGGDDDRRPDA
ncbi:DDE superfamily endonuclease [Micromonospora cremea]|uniref:DDE superfamily endonuclease n=1 Tax=Micromonospora cremea TaxID=709881 RepID=A0A1N6BFG4_9ACTN|nr:DDE superfamily endonuclease [Micromonospora cremea]